MARNVRRAIGITERPPPIATDPGEAYLPPDGVARVICHASFAGGGPLTDCISSFEAPQGAGFGQPLLVLADQDNAVALDPARLVRVAGARLLSRRRLDLDRHRLTSREIGSPGVI